MTFVLSSTCLVCPGQKCNLCCLSESASEWIEVGVAQNQPGRIAQVHVSTCQGSILAPVFCATAKCSFWAARRRSGGIVHRNSRRGSHGGGDGGTGTGGRATCRREIWFCPMRVFVCVCVFRCVLLCFVMCVCVLECGCVIFQLLVLFNIAFPGTSSCVRVFRVPVLGLSSRNANRKSHIFRGLAIPTPIHILSHNWGAQKRLVFRF